MLANGASPVNGMITFSFDVVILKVNVPDLNTTGGFGVAFAFRKKKHPIKSPQLSLFKSILVTVATAPLETPVNFAPFTRYPKYFSKFANPIPVSYTHLTLPTTTIV